MSTHNQIEHVHHTMMDEHSHINNSNLHKGIGKNETFVLAVKATIHCLIGCGLGEVLGMIIGTAFQFSMFQTMSLAITLGLIGGILLGIVPLIKSGFNLKLAFKTVIVGEGLSIVIMEAFEVGTQLLIPGVMEAQKTDFIFWGGMIASLAVGFVAALPVNIIMIKKGIRHRH